MAIFDYILQYANEVEISDYPIIGKSVSRGGIITTVQAQPKIWKIKINLSNPALRFDDTEARNFLENIRDVNTFKSFDLTFKNTPNLYYINKYQQELIPETISFSGKAGSTEFSSGAVLLPGDYVQPFGGSVYTIVKNKFGGLILNRPLFKDASSSAYVGQYVTWKMYLEKVGNCVAASNIIKGMVFPTTFEFVEDISL